MSKAMKKLARARYSIWRYGKDDLGVEWLASLRISNWKKTGGKLADAVVPFDVKEAYDRASGELADGCKNAQRWYLASAEVSRFNRKYKEETEQAYQQMRLCQEAEESYDKATEGKIEGQNVSPVTKKYALR